MLWRLLCGRFPVRHDKLQDRLYGRIGCSCANFRVNTACNLRGCGLSCSQSLSPSPSPSPSRSHSHGLRLPAFYFGVSDVFYPAVCTLYTAYGASRTKPVDEILFTISVLLNINQPRSVPTGGCFMCVSGFEVLSFLSVRHLRSLRGCFHFLPSLLGLHCCCCCCFGAVFWLGLQECVNKGLEDHGQVPNGKFPTIAFKKVQQYTHAPYKYCTV